MKTDKHSGSLWYVIKQNVENGFKMAFNFRFKKERSQSSYLA
jgi:hypothetical protein